MKFSDILKEGIPIYGEYESNINKKILDKLKGYYSNTPEYVLNDIFNTNIKQHTNDIVKNYYNDPVLFLARFDGGYWDNFLKGPWNLEIIDVNPEDFDENTVNAFLERDFGNIDSYLVPKDEERTSTQRRLAKPTGMNEPVIVVRKPNGKYELIEGWHRTMSILLLGNNGEDLKNWNKVKIRAFVRDVYKQPN
jgi:hypothetical protein